VATISIHTHTHTPHTSENSSDFGHYKIQIQFPKYFSDIVYNVKHKIEFAKNRGAGPPGSAPVYSLHRRVSFIMIIVSRLLGDVRCTAVVSCKIKKTVRDEDSVIANKAIRVYPQL